MLYYKFNVIKINIDLYLIGNSPSTVGLMIKLDVELMIGLLSSEIVILLELIGIVSNNLGTRKG